MPWLVLEVCCIYGEGGREDKARARHLYSLAAERGIAQGQYNLALMLKRGEGGPKDETEAARLFKLAAEQGVK